MKAASRGRLVTIADAAEHCAANERTVRRWIESGVIAGYRTGPRLLRVDIDEIDRRAVRPIPARPGGAA
jgi:excisionase family DNA binding protein